MRDKLCVALDVEYARAATIIDILEGKGVGWLKFGPTLLTHTNGVYLMDYAKRRGFKIFADYKFKDVPSVVGKAIANLTRMADLVTVHIDGGLSMLEEAKVAASDKLKVVGVTLLTSLNSEDLARFGCPSTVENYINNMVEVAVVSGISGIVCSAQEVGNIKKSYPGLFCVTPGLKMGLGNQPDQKRSSDPKFAYQEGSDLLVMGREIYDSENMVRRIDEIEQHCLSK